MSESFIQVASALAATAAEFHARGWMLGTSGNLSTVCDRDPLRLAITSSGVDKGALQPEEIILIDEQARAAESNGRKPSDESPLHVRIVKERQAGAVFHTHSVWSTMLSDLHFADGGVAIEGFEMLKGLDGVKTHEHREWIPILKNSQNMPALADEIAANLRDYTNAHGFLLHRHGLYTWGKDRIQAKRHVEILEFLFETVVRLRLIETNSSRSTN